MSTLVEKLQQKKAIGPSAYPCNVLGFLCEMSQIIQRSHVKWGDSWNSANFSEEAEAIKFLAEDMQKCVAEAKENKTEDQKIHEK